MKNNNKIIFKGKQRKSRLLKFYKLHRNDGFYSKIYKFIIDGTPALDSPPSIVPDDFLDKKEDN